MVPRTIATTGLRLIVGGDAVVTLAVVGEAVAVNTSSKRADYHVCRQLIDRLIEISNLKTDEQMLPLHLWSLSVVIERRSLDAIRYEGSTSDCSTLTKSIPVYCYYPVETMNRYLPRLESEYTHH